MQFEFYDRQIAIYLRAVFFTQVATQERYDSNLAEKSHASPDYLLRLRASNLPTVGSIPQSLPNLLLLNSPPQILILLNDDQRYPL